MRMPNSRVYKLANTFLGPKTQWDNRYRSIEYRKPVEWPSGYNDVHQQPNRRCHTRKMRRSENHVDVGGVAGDVIANYRFRRELSYHKEGEHLDWV